jgi:hypothetical protein
MKATALELKHAYSKDPHQMFVAISSKLGRSYSGRENALRDVVTESPFGERMSPMRFEQLVDYFYKIISLKSRLVSI